MAPKHILLLLLWNLSFFVHAAVSLCEVTCSTDYNVSLNCSCADVVQVQSVFLHVSCSKDDIEVNMSCEVQPSQSWCVMFPVMFEEVTSVGTVCAAQATDKDGVAINGSESSGWALCDVVKPEPPSKVQVTDMDGFYNITWDHSYQMDCLTYTVRIREAHVLPKEPVYSLSSDGKRLQLDHKRLQPGVNYTVDVKAKMCPSNLYNGPWSEWSSTAHFRSAGPDDVIPSSRGAETMNWHLIYIPPSVLAFVILSYLIRKQEFTHIPKPDYLFTPLYRNYGGNFKEWVNPVFKENDYSTITLQVQGKSKHDVPQLNGEKPNVETTEVKPDNYFRHDPQAHGGSLPPCLDGSSRSGDWIGHISIHTVTLSEERGFEEEATSQNSACVLRGDQDRESFELFGEEMEDLENAESGLLPRLQHRASDDSSLGRDPLHVHLFEEERASLDSLTLNEQSDDGYPHVDLDTIDSGFGEYNGRASRGTQHSFHEHKNLHSNYVKQWMVCKTVEEG